MALELAEELAGADFSDARLTKRAIRIVQELGNKPNLSIPAALDKRAELEGAYRFCDNPNVTPERILAPHYLATLERVQQTETAILVQDTTDIDLTRPEQQVAGAGPLEFETRLGVLHHPLLSFDESGLCLGLLWKKTWARESIHSGRSASEKQKDCRDKSIAEKESVRWIEGLQAARRTAEACPHTRCVMAADSESDIYEIFAEPRTTSHGRPVELLIRAAYNRCVDDPHQYLWQAVQNTPLRAESTIQVSARRQKKIKIAKRKRQAPRESRVAKIQIRATEVTLIPPSRIERDYSPISINAVIVEELNPPGIVEPIEWLLLTTLPINTDQELQLILSYYSIRWQIEIYFRTLKSGCRIEERYFEKLRRFENALALYSVVAWRILYLCRLSRECPDLDCEVVFSPEEWKAVYVAVNRTAPPKTPPRLNEIVRLIASLGGYVIRNSTQPGTQTLWIGLQRLNDLALGWVAFGPDTRAKNFLD